MARLDVPLARLKFGQTARRDLWWFPPLVVFTILSAFLTYATWAALQGVHFRYGPYLSPFYSPLLFARAGHAWFGQPPEWFPVWMTPAMLILPIPAGFRLTCYYYRGAYYKSFWADPPGCAVGEPRATYLGERSFPLIIQNIHRYFLYLAIAFIGILSYDVYEALWFPGADGALHFWYRRGHAGPDDQRPFSWAESYYIWLPHAPPPRRRGDGQGHRQAGAQSGV